ncbi:MAG: (Fe-S)-binding protein, partial [Anaerolineae bacterium]
HKTPGRAIAMFIAKSYDLKMETPGCVPGSEYWNATARFDEDMSEVFPYLNAVWEDVIYSPAAKQITWRRDDHSVALKPKEITISNLPDRDTATVEMEKVIAEINRIWMDRENITPLGVPRKRLVAMEVYQLLPQTNCRACGEASCFVFAGKVATGQADLQACTPLIEDDQYADKREALLDMLSHATS